MNHPSGDVLVLGAGKIGSTIATMLSHHHGCAVTLADQSISGRTITTSSTTSVLALDARDAKALRHAMAGHPVVINALPFFLAQEVAATASEMGVHYFDLTEDVAATTSIRRLAQSAKGILMPQCGIAPGVIGMLGGDLASRFDELYDLRLRVGALARHSTNALRYNFTWSIDGVINEYCNPCDAIVNGQRQTLQPLEGHETLTLDAEEFEAFNTSGGLGTLCETLDGKVRNLDYKTIRYPGHRDAMAFLLHDMRLIEKRDTFREILEHAVPHSREDLVILFASASGTREGRFQQETRLARIHGAPLCGIPRTAIELTTAAGVVGAYELLKTGKLPQSGFVSQEQIPLSAFLDTRVGQYFKDLVAQDERQERKACVFHT